MSSEEWHFLRFKVEKKTKTCSVGFGRSRITRSNGSNKIGVLPHPLYLKTKLDPIFQTYSFLRFLNIFETSKNRRRIKSKRKKVVKSVSFSLVLFYSHRIITLAQRENKQLIAGLHLKAL
jgi:hypothetical protein